MRAVMLDLLVAIQTHRERQRVTTIPVTNLARIGEHSKQRSQNDSPEGAQIEPYNPGNSTDASPASRSVEDTRNVVKKLCKASERIRKCLEPKKEKNSPSRPREVPYDLGGETAIPGGIHNVQECSEGVRNECADGTDAPSRVIDPGGHLEVQGNSRVVEGDPDRTKVIEGAGCNGK